MRTVRHIRAAGTRAAAVWQMSRPEQVALIVVVFAAGVAAGLASGGAEVAAVPWALAALVPTAVSVHVVNEYADHATDLLTARTAFSGGSGALQQFGLHRRAALWVAVVTGLIGLGLTGLGVLLGGLGTLAALLLGVGLVGGWQYSVGPLAFSRRGAGEPVNAALGGLLLPVYGVATVGSDVLVRDVLAFLPFALLVFVNLLETQWPDRDADRAVGKATLVVRVSPATVRTLAAVAVVTAYGLLPVLVWAEVLPPAVALASLVGVPLSVWGLIRLTRAPAPLPAVMAMVAVVVAQALAWAGVGWSGLVWLPGA